MGHGNRTETAIGQALVGAVCVLVASGMFAKELYVATDGNDAVTYVANDIDHPWRTVDKALHEMQAGDTTLQPYVSALDVAVAYAGLGEADSTLTWLSAAYEERASELFLVPLDPRFDGVRSDARFQELLDRHWRSGEFD